MSIQKLQWFTFNGLSEEQYQANLEVRRKIYKLDQEIKKSKKLNLKK